MDQETLKNNNFPTIYDYEDTAALGTMALVDEIQGQSKLILDASVVPTNAGFHHEFNRIIEKKYKATASAFDEGYRTSGGTRTTRTSFGTMRVTDAKDFDELTERLTTDNGIAERMARIANLSESIITEKARCLLYGGMPHPDDSIDAKEIPGLFSYIDKISDYQAMNAKWENGLCPFPDENCLAIDNQEGSEASDTTALEDLQDDSVWASVLCVAFGSGEIRASKDGRPYKQGGVVTTYPRNLPLIGGYNLEYHEHLHDNSVDKYDGLNKHRFYDLVTGESCFGIGIYNRFCLGGLRNIYLAHKKKDDTFDEMYRIEQNLIRIKSWFEKGKTGLTMNFYAPAALVEQMNAYKNNKVIKVDVGNNRNKGTENDVLTPSVYISDGITVWSDFAFKTSEAFVS